ncbi:acyl carrier protein [bacterium]|nr:acyl carrier protein [bacterium]
MERNEIVGQVKEIVSKELSVGLTEVKEEASFIDDLGADSLDTVELVMALEEKFKLDIPDEDAQNIKTVKDAVDYIESKQ